MLLMPDFDDVPDALDGELNGAPDAATSCARWNHVRIRSASPFPLATRFATQRVGTSSDGCNRERNSAL